MNGGNEKTNSEIRGYLLGQISSQDRSRVEERLMNDAAYFERSELAEDELIEAYVRGDLPIEERENVESHFLTTPERRQRVEMNRALRMVLADSSLPLRTSAPVRLTGVRRMAARGLALAASLFICLGVICYLTWDVSRLRNTAARQEREWRQELAAQREQIRKLEEQLQHARTQGFQRETSRPSDSGAVAKRAVLSFLLSPDVVMRGSQSEGPSLLMASTEAPVQLQLAIEPDADRRVANYGVVLKTTDGHQVWSASNLSVTRTGARRTMTLSLPAGVLAPGQYRLTLLAWMPNGGVEELDDYSFRVVQR